MALRPYDVVIAAPTIAANTRLGVMGIRRHQPEDVQSKCIAALPPAKSVHPLSKHSSESLSLLHLHVALRVLLGRLLRRSTFC